jgi:hypothetical protein
VVELVGPRLVDDRAQRRGLEELALDECQALADRCQVRLRGRDRLTDHADHLIALCQQQFGQVRAVLPADPRDERAATGHPRERNQRGG